MEATRKSGDARGMRNKAEEMCLDVMSSKTLLCGAPRRHSKDCRSRSSSYSSRSSSRHSSTSPRKLSRSGSESSDEEFRKCKMKKRRSSSSEESVVDVVVPKKNKTSSVHNVRRFRKRSSSASQSRSPSVEESDIDLKHLSDVEKRTSHSSEKEIENCFGNRSQRKVPSKENYVDTSRKNSVTKSRENSPFRHTRSRSKERSCSIDSRVEKSVSRERNLRRKDKSPLCDLPIKASDHLRPPERDKEKKSRVPEEKEQRSRSKSRDKKSRSCRSRSRSQSRGRRSRSRGRRSRSRGHRSRSCRSRSRGRRSRSRSRSRGRRSRSRGRRSRSRDRRGRSYRSRRDDSPRRRRSRSRDRYSYRRLSPRKRRSRSRDRSRSRERRHHSRSRSGSHDRHRHRYRRRRSSSHNRYKRRHTASRSRSRSGSHLSPREKSKGDLVSTTASLGSLPLTTTAGAMTPQMALQQTMAQMSAKAQALTGIALPKYYNPAAVNPLKYAEQVQKRKLLWQTKEKPEETSKSTVWDKLTFSQDDDGKMTAKFRKLMGMKSDSLTGDKSDEGESNKSGDESALKKQEELFRNLNQQYEMARMSTHTHRGVGLGYTSQAIYPPLQK